MLIDSCAVNERAACTLSAAVSGLHQARGTAADLAETLSAAARQRNVNHADLLERSRAEAG